MNLHLNNSSIKCLTQIQIVKFQILKVKEFSDLLKLPPIYEVLSRIGS